MNMNHIASTVQVTKVGNDSKRNVRSRDWKQVQTVLDETRNGHHLIKFLINRFKDTLLCKKLNTYGIIVNWYPSKNYYTDEGEG